MAGLVVRPSNVTWLAWPRSWLPDKRVKLTGGDRFKGNGVLCAGAHELSFNDGALRASRPQLKRDPLGGSRPPFLWALVRSANYENECNTRPRIPGSSVRLSAGTCHGDVYRQCRAF